MQPRARRLALALAPLGVAASLALAPGVASAQQPPPARAADPDPWTGPDKALHFTASAALAGGGYGLGALGMDGVPGRLALGAALALALGAAKEGLDAAGYGTPSWRDFAWDVTGAAFGLMFSFSIDQAARPARHVPAR